MNLKEVLAANGDRVVTVPAKCRSDDVHQPSHAFLAAGTKLASV
jgi:hypothetical protein